MNTTIWEELQSLHEGYHLTLNEHCALAIARGGRVVFGSDFFIAGYPVADRGWFVTIAVGHNAFRSFIAVMPYYLPYIGWCRGKRNNEVRWYRTEQLLRKLMGGAPSLPPPPGPPAPPTKDQAAKNLNDQGVGKAPMGFTSTILGDNKNQSDGKKTLLGG